MNVSRRWNQITPVGVYVTKAPLRRGTAVTDTDLIHFHHTDITLDRISLLELGCVGILVAWQLRRYAYA